MGSGEKSVLFLCVGNSCRSPVCVGICNNICPSLRAGSAGLTPGSGVGSPANPHSITVCKENGIDISSHTRRQFENNDWVNWKVIAALDSLVFQTVQETKTKDATATLVLFNPPNGVEDPYKGEIEQYRSMFRAVREAMQPFLETNDLV
jgi:protein-tyrosine phosphatase